MSLIREKMVATVGNTGTITLNIPTLESAIVRDIRLYGNNPAAENMTITVEQKTIMQFVVPARFNLLQDDRTNGPMSVFDAIRKMGFFAGIPVAAGETITFGPTAASQQAELVYDLHTAGDFKNTDDNGSLGNRYQMFQVVSNSAGAAAGATVVLDQSDLNAVFPRFPGGARVPADSRMILHGFFGAPAIRDNGVTIDWYTDRLLIIRNQIDILAKDLLGTWFRANQGVANITDVQWYAEASRLDVGHEDMPASVIMLNEPLVFESGEELTISATTVVGPGGNPILAGDVKLGLIFEVIRRV